jgi:hypothetical protein
MDPSANQAQPDHDRRASADEPAHGPAQAFDNVSDRAKSAASGVLASISASTAVSTARSGSEPPAGAEGDSAQAAHRRPDTSVRTEARYEPVDQLVDEAAGTSAGRGEPSAWMVIPPVIGVIVLLVLGVHPPGALVELLQHAAALLSGAAR